VSSQQLINELLRLLPVGPRLNEMYMTAVASADYRRIVYGNPIFEGEIGRVCFITASALAWVLSGRDAHPPIGARWRSSFSGCGEAGVRVVGWSSETSCDEFDEGIEHVAVFVGDTVFESCWRSRFLCASPASRSAAALEGLNARHIPLDVCANELRSRVTLVIDY